MQRRALLGSGLAGAFASAAGARGVAISPAALPDALTAEWAGGAERNQLAGVAVSVVRAGEPDLFWCHGHAELIFRAPVTRQTLFPIGSLDTVESFDLQGVTVARYRLVTQQSTSHFVTG
jgi:CubicO group peptidase (beta-lactamase class C family)